MDAFSDDTILCLMEYIPSSADLWNFASTSRRTWIMCNDEIHDDRFHRSLYLHMYFKGSKYLIRSRLKYQNDRTKFNTRDASTAWSWKKEFHRQRILERSLKLSAKYVDNDTSDRKKRKRVGILSTKDEDESAQYDEPRIVSLSNNAVHEFSFGYFGIEAFSLAGLRDEMIPPSFGSDSPVVVWGDFHGVRIFKSIDCFLYENENNDEYGVNPNVQSIGQEFGQQVLTVLTCPFDSKCNKSNVKKKTNSFPCFFLGLADGTVVAVMATFNKLCNKKDLCSQCTFTTRTSTVTEESYHAHGDEVTSLCFLKHANESLVLVSASVDGTVLLYPHAVCCGSLDKTLLAVTNISSSPVLALTSALSQDGGDILFTGDQIGYINIWLSKKKSFNFHWHSSHKATFSNRTNIAGRRIIVTHICLAMNRYLISANNSGEIMIWDIEQGNFEPCRRQHCISPQDGRKISLKLCHHLRSAHHGAIELMRVSGDILLSSGFCSSLNAWNITTGAFICRLNCSHRFENNPLASKVSTVGFIITKNSIISILRNGILKEWKYNCTFTPRSDFKTTNAQKQTKPESWACPRCTLLNQSNRRFCAVCSFANRRRKPRPTRKKRKTHHLMQNLPHASAPSSPDTKNPLPCLAEPLKTIMTWICTRCNYTKNPSKQRYCLICGCNDSAATSDSSSNNILNEVSKKYDQVSHNTIITPLNSDKKLSLERKKWPCPKCTMMNPFDNYICSICFYRRAVRRRATTTISDKTKLSLKFFTTENVKDDDDSNHINYNQNPYATARSTTPGQIVGKSKDHERWICLQCSHINKDSNESCSICQFSRQEKDVTAAFQGSKYNIQRRNSEMEIFLNGSIKNVNRTVKMNNVDEKIKINDGIIKMKENSDSWHLKHGWMCSRCSFENESKSEKCAICLSLNSTNPQMNTNTQELADHTIVNNAFYVNVKVILKEDEKKQGHACILVAKFLAPLFHLSTFRCNSRHLNTAKAQTQSVQSLKTDSIKKNSAKTGRIEDRFSARTGVLPIKLSSDKVMIKKSTTLQKSSYNDSLGKISLKTDRCKDNAGGTGTPESGTKILSWNCKRCSLTNAGGMSKCYVCQTTKPSEINIWECVKCSFFNSSTELRCAMCNSWKPSMRRAG